MAKATDCKSVLYEFESHPCLYQVIEESGLSRLTWDEEHAGSNPAYPTIKNIDTEFKIQLSLELNSYQCLTGKITMEVYLHWKQEVIGSSPIFRTICLVV